MPDLFAIDCTTCKSRLRVRDVAIIGQILACPKCSSMVLIEPPPGWQPPAAEGATLPGPTTPPPAPHPATARTATPDGGDPNSFEETVSDSDFREVDAFLGGAAKPDASPKSVAAKQSVPTKAAQPSLPPQTKSAAEKRRNTPTPVPPPPAETAAAAIPQNAEPPPPATSAATTSDWTSARVKRVRLLAMLTVAGCMGVASAIGAATFIASWASGKRTPQVAENTTPPTSPPATAPSAEATTPDSDVASSPVEQPSVDESSSDEKAPPGPQGVAVAPPMAEKPAAPEEPTVVEKTPTDDKPKDPLGLVDDAATKPMGEGSDPLKLDELRKLAKLFPGEANPVPAEPSSAVDSSAEALSESEMEAESAASRPRPEMRKVDVAARLADRLSEIEFDGQPLGEVIQFLSDFSTIPITIEPEALVWSRITSSAPVKAKLTNVTLHEVLMEILKPFRLEAVVSGDQVVVTRSANLRLIKCPIGDLTGGDAEQQKQLVEFIEQLAAPTSWKSAGGEGTIVPQGDVLLIENNELAYGEVMQVCERLRVARGARPKSVFPAEVFALERRAERAARKLDTPLTLNFSQSTLLVKILDRFAKESGTAILVDWRALAEVGWPPEADATVTLNKTPLRQALSELLAPMDLTYRVVDGKTLQVTTLQAIERQPEIEVYQVGDLAATSEDASTLVEQLTPSLGDSAVLRYDAASTSLFALLPQPQHEQLAQLLDDLRTK